MHTGDRELLESIFLRARTQAGAKQATPGLALVGLTPAGRCTVCKWFGGIVADVEQNNPGGTCREAGSLLSHHHFLGKAEWNLPQLSMTKV